jgi:hypothetical protein
MCDQRWASLTPATTRSHASISDETEERQKTRTVWQIVTNAEPTAAASVFHSSSRILGFNRFGRPARAARTLT